LLLLSESLLKFRDGLRHRFSFDCACFGVPKLVGAPVRLGCRLLLLAAVGRLVVAFLLVADGLTHCYLTATVYGLDLDSSLLSDFKRSLFAF
jgi:hypothetical protein